MCCAYDVTTEPVNQPANDFNALPVDWASDPVLLAGLRVDDDDEHDDPVLRWPDGRGWIRSARTIPMTRR